MVNFEFENLVDQARSGDQVAFATLYQMMRTNLLPGLTKKSPPRIDAEDIFEDTFIKTWDIIDKLKDYNNLISYARKVANNLLMKKIFRERRLVPLNEDGSDIGYLDSALKNPYAEEVYCKILSSLDEKEKLLFYYIYIKNENSKEIQKKMNLSIELFNLKKFRLRKKLQHILVEYYSG